MGINRTKSKTGYLREKEYWWERAVSKKKKKDVKHRIGRGSVIARLEDDKNSK